MNAISKRRRTPTTRRPRDEAKALYRNAILEAAEAVFAERGFHGARIQDIAARAQIAVGTLYNHFEQKDDVLHALLDDRLDQLVDQLAPLDADPVEFRERLTARIGRWLHFADEHRAFFVIAVEHGLASVAAASSASHLVGKSARSIARARACFLEIMEEGVRACAIAGDIRVLARFFAGGLRSFSLGAIQDGDTDLRRHARLVVAVFMDGASGSAMTRAAAPVKKRTRTNHRV